MANLKCATTEISHLVFVIAEQFAMTPEPRLASCAEKHAVRAKEQAGCGKNYRTIDTTFTSSLTDKQQIAVFWDRDTCGGRWEGNGCHTAVRTPRHDGPCSAVQAI